MSKVQRLFSVTEIELVYHSKVKPNDRLKINSADMAFAVFLDAWDMNKIELCEQSMILLLNRANHCLGITSISSGGVSDCLIDPKIVFAAALKAKSSGIILAHNHPSGNTTPSKADIILTEKIKAGGVLLDIAIMDHLIITPQSYYSFANEGLVL